MPPTKSNLYFPKATLEAVSNISVKRGENCNAWYILDTKSGKNQYFLGVGETSQGKTPPPKCRRMFLGKKSISESSLSKKMYVCVKQAYQNSATNTKVSIFILYDINLICSKFGTFTLICMTVPKGWCYPFYYVYLMPV